MKVNLHLYQWVLCLLLMVSGNAMAAKVVSLDDLKAGSVIAIYPHGYGENPLYALACNGNGQNLTSYENARKGNNWTIVDAGDGSYYLKNELGCYWAYQNSDSWSSLICTTDEASAVKIKFTYDDTNEGVCFWNQTDGKGLNNLYSSNSSYNWYSSPSGYNDGDTNTTFDVYTGYNSYEFATIDGFKLVLNLTEKTATIIANDYSGGIVVPQYVNYEGNDYAITSADFSIFKGCTSIDARYCGGNISGGAFSYCSNLTSVSFGNVESIGERAFSYCSNLTSVSFGNVESIGAEAFYGCSNLRSFTIPSGLKYLANDAFGYSWRGNDDIFIKCYVENPEDIKVESDFSLSCKRFFVLKSSLEDYKNTKPWSDMADKIYPLPDVFVSQITLPETAHVSKQGDEGKIQLVPTLYPDNADDKTVEWKSSDTGIATVDENGYVTGVKSGEAVITAVTMDGSALIATCKVTVGAITPESVTFVDMPTEIYVGKYIENVTSKVKVTPENAEYTALTITTSDKDVLRYYNTDKILAKKEGTVQVTATVTLLDGSELSASCDVKVVADPAGIEQASSDDSSVISVNGYTLSVSGLAANEKVTVATVAGNTVYSGNSHEIALPGSGIYIIKVKDKIAKISVK